MPIDQLPLRAYYAARAQEYDRVYEKPERQAAIRTLKSLLPPLFEDRQVLDVAAGTGYWTEHIADTARSVVAVDSSAETLEVARARLGGKPVQLQVGDAYALGDELGMFDAAFLGFWFSHVPIERRTSFMSGLRARLLPGSIVVMVDNLYVEGSNHPVVHTDATGNTFQQRTLGDGSTHQVLKNFPSETELRSLTDDVAVRSSWQTLKYYWVFDFETARAG